MSTVSTPTGTRTNPLARAWDGWQRWAFDPVDTAPMAALRIAVGLLTLLWAVSYLPDAEAFLSDEGVAPQLPERYDSWAWNAEIGSPYLALGLLCLVSVSMALGFHTRVTSIVVVVLLIAIQRRDPLTLNSGDVLLRNMALFVALMPSGETWSLDARLRKRAPRPRAPWGLRLLQLQVSIVYLAAVMAKLRGDTWNEGTAVGIALQLEDLQRFAVPESLTTSLAMSSAMTYGTLVLETLLVFGLWLPRTRLVVAVLGVLMHVGIDLTLAVGWFSYALVAAYLAFVPPERLHALLARVRARRGGSGSPPAPPAGPPPADQPEPVSLAKAGGLGSQG